MALEEKEESKTPIPDIKNSESITNQSNEEANTKLEKAGTDSIGVSKVAESDGKQKKEIGGGNESSSSNTAALLENPPGILHREGDLPDELNSCKNVTVKDEKEIVAQTGESSSKISSEIQSENKADVKNQLEEKANELVNIKEEPKSPLLPKGTEIHSAVDSAGSLVSSSEKSEIQTISDSSKKHVDTSQTNSESPLENPLNVKKEVINKPSDSSVKSIIDPKQSKDTNISQILVTSSSNIRESVDVQKSLERPKTDIETTDENASKLLKAVKIDSSKEDIKNSEIQPEKITPATNAETLMNGVSVTSSAKTEADHLKAEHETQNITQRTPLPLPLQGVKTESKAVHEIIAEQSVKLERVCTPVSAIPAERTESAQLFETLVTKPPEEQAPVGQETKVFRDFGEDWDIPASDEEEEITREKEGAPKRVAVKRGYWEPPTEVIVELYRKLDKEGILELSWKCPGRRPPSEEGDKDDEKELEEEKVDEEAMEISQEEEDPTEFDFDMDTDSSVQKMTTPRRAIGKGQAQGSGKKRTARMDKVLSDIFRHRKIDSAAQAEEKKQGVVVTSESKDTTPTSTTVSNIIPSRPPDKFHIRSDLT